MNQFSCVWGQMLSKCRRQARARGQAARAWLLTLGPAASRLSTLLPLQLMSLWLHTLPRLVPGEGWGGTPQAGPQPPDPQLRSSEWLLHHYMKKLKGDFTTPANYMKLRHQGP